MGGCLTCSKSSFTTCCSCCIAINNLLATFAKKKRVVLGVGLCFLVSLSIMLFAVLTKDVCYFGLQIRGPGMYVVTISLILLIGCSTLLLHSMYSENAPWILVMDFLIFALWICHIVGYIVAAVAYSKSEEHEKGHTSIHGFVSISTLAILILEISWFMFIIIIYKFYYTIKENKEKPETFEEN
ncbi:unnamed protein product [Brassicogethes aeneus]|uniref:Transmembrane protein n=1 Tax=Brassicogethes aeneus TaxID=1431903 RepID=A0A9P0AXP8_BRAAE|nr:unnamed protein product [Brassicogethes aeneus]